ncbi:GGDEF domain-containing protein [Shewanella maritima]|uniref:diguanylate cyclase n=1 Tax=Shewanella maritima TaxID=2520507 RepID=A0A411PLX9_9GAMM|nr:GGDEF domain-containing protein [Shewanella maritima]QBF84533.1 GGDEF domain-containing protein [Shewanella maritima]
MPLAPLINLGTQGQAFSSANRIKTTNIIALITTGISFGYTLFFLIAINHLHVGLINFGFTCAYFATLAFSLLQQAKLAKIWFFGVLMAHLLVCTFVYMTKDSGFHLYFFLVPTGVFLLFELNERAEKLLLSVIAVILFLYCENTMNADPLLLLTETTNHMLYQSVILVNMIEVIFVLNYFAKQIDSNEKQLVLQASTDSLTQLMNRHQFFITGNHLFAQYQASNKPFSLVLLDIDHFKKINDKYGHINGDKCLKAVSQTLIENSPADASVARIGGEEFVVLMPNTTFELCRTKAEKLRKAIADTKINLGVLTPGAQAEGEQTELICTASFGFINAHDKHTEFKDLLIQADKALYRAKENGRNRVESYLDHVA